MVVLELGSSGARLHPAVRICSLGQGLVSSPTWLCTAQPVQSKTVCDGWGTQGQNLSWLLFFFFYITSIPTVISFFS